MKGRVKSAIQLTVLFSVAIFLIWLSLSKITSKQLEEIKSAFLSANYMWVALSMLIAAFAHFLRAYRWNYLLEPAGHKVGLLTGNCQVMIGYFANYGIPRMGEITRCTLAARYDKVPFEVGLGTVITERIVDFAVFILIFLVAIAFETSKLTQLADEHIFSKVGALLEKIMSQPAYLIAVCLSVAAIVLLFYFFRKKISGALGGKFTSALKGMINGISSVRKLKKPVQFIVLSLLIWTCYFYALYMCFFAFPQTSSLGHRACMALLLFGTLGVIFTPGGLGAYPAIIQLVAATLYGVDDVAGIALGWLSWGSQFVLVVILGLISLFILPYVGKRRDVASQQAPQ